MGILNLFGKKEKEQIEFPYHYLEVDWTRVAKFNGTFDDFNKEIRRIKNGEIVDTPIPYTKEELLALSKAFGIPFVDRTKNKEDENFEFETMDSLTGTWREER